MRFTIDPLPRHGNAINLEVKTKEIFSSGNNEISSHVKKSYCSVLQIGCIPTDVQRVYTHAKYTALGVRVGGGVVSEVKLLKLYNFKTSYFLFLKIPDRYIESPGLS